MGKSTDEVCSHIHYGVSIAVSPLKIGPSLWKILGPPLGNATIKTSGRLDVSLHSLPHCTACLIKNKINSCMPRSAPSCGARLPALPHAARNCPLLVSARGHLRVVAARLPAMPGAQPPASRGARLLALPGAVSCRIATAEPLPPANSTCRRTSILPSNEEMFALKLHVASVCF